MSLTTKGGNDGTEQKKARPPRATEQFYPTEQAQRYNRFHKITPAMMEKFRKFIEWQVAELERYNNSGRATVAAVNAKQNSINQLIDIYNSLEDYISTLEFEAAGFHILLGNQQEKIKAMELKLMFWNNMIYDKQGKVVSIFDYERELS